MTREAYAPARTLGALELFITVLTILIALAAQAQQADTSHPSVVKSSASGANNAQPTSLARARGNAGTVLDSDPIAFLSAVTYSSGGVYSYSVAVADVNGDGKPDLLVASCSPGSSCGGNEGVVGVLLGNGDGTFQPAVTYYAGGNESTSVAVGDLNGDGKPDLVVANSYVSDNIGVLLGAGDGTFTLFNTFSSGGGDPWSVRIADLNRDGKPDILEAVDSSCESCAGALGVLLGNGAGNFAPAVLYGSGGYGTVALAVGDFNGDGKLDVAVANPCGVEGDCSGQGTIGVLLGNGDGSFQPAVSYGSGGVGLTINSLAVADVNGDGIPDLLVANSNCINGDGCKHGTIGVLLGNGDGTFQTPLLFDTGAYDTPSVAVADLNGDGIPDLVAVNFCSTKRCHNTGSGSVSIMQGNGDGSFQAPTIYSSDGYWGAFSPAIADVNGDGKPDVIVVNLEGEGKPTFDGSVGVLLNNTGNVAGTTTTLTSSLNPSFYGQTVVFTAQVSATTGTPTGTVVFKNGPTTLGSGTLANGVTSISVASLPKGRRSITAAYQGSSTFAPSTSAPLIQFVLGKPAPSKTVVTTSGSPSQPGQRVTFTATVTSTDGAIPNGETVTFYDNGAGIGTGTTAGGVATFTTSTLSSGKHTIKGTYAGDATFKSSSGTVKQAVE
jgi:hypothetical protein